MQPSAPDLPQKLRDELNDHWAEVWPREAVGLILDDGSTLRLRNWSRRPDRFLVGWWSIWLKLGWQALKTGAGIQTIYHSHLVSAQPSLQDRQFMSEVAKKWPHVNHLIYVPAYEYSIWEYQ